MRSDKKVILLAVASCDDQASLRFLEELWSDGAVSDGRTADAPVAGRSAMLERDGIDFVVRAVGQGAPDTSEEVLKTANAVVLISTGDAAENARYREELTATLRGMRPGNAPEKFVIGAGTSAFTCLDALRDKVERRQLEEARTVRMDLRTIESLARTTAESDDWSEAATERVNLAEITMFTKPSRPTPVADDITVQIPLGRMPAEKKKPAAKRKPAAKKKKLAAKKKPAPKKRPVAKKKKKKPAATKRVTKKRPAKKKPAAKKRR